MSCEKGLCQEGYPAVKLCFKPERIYVISNIAERNNGTGTLCEGVSSVRSKSYTKESTLEQPSATVQTIKVGQNLQV